MHPIKHFITIDVYKRQFLDSIGEGGNGLYENLDQYREKWEHPIWQRYLKEGVKGGHDGMDWLVYSAFFEGILSGRQPVIDTYDMASWMAITPLSEISIACLLYTSSETALLICRS